MVRVGLVDIDTTHAWVLGNYLNSSNRAKVVAITDAGTIWPAEHLKRLATSLDAEIVESVEQMVERVDAALFLGTRYDLRLERALPMIKAGKSVFLDKPAVGSINHVLHLKKLLDSGARIMCGSSLPFCQELNQIKKMMSNGHPSSLTVIGCKEFFEHGIHAADIGFSIAQSPAQRVQWSAFGPCEIVWAELKNGLPIALFLESPGNTWSVIGMNCEKTLSQTLNLSLYRHCHYARLVNAFLEMEQSGRMTLSPYWHLESIKLLIAAKRSREEGQVVELDELKESDSFDGREYARTYCVTVSQANPDNYLSPDVKVLMRKRPQMKNVTLAGFTKKIVHSAISKAKTITKLVLRPKGTKFIKQMLRRD